MDEGVSVLAWCIVRFMPRGGFVVGWCFFLFLSKCSGFGMPLDCLSMFSGIELMRVAGAWKLASDCLPPGHFCMVD